MKPTFSSKPGAEFSKKLARRREHPLDVFFTPNNIAVIGATENVGSVGATV